MTMLERATPAADRPVADPHAQALAQDIIALVKTYERLSGKGASNLITKARKARTLDELAVLRDNLVGEISKARRKLLEKCFAWGGLPLAVLLFEAAYEVGFMSMPYLCDALLFSAMFAVGLWVAWMMYMVERW